MDIAEGSHADPTAILSSPPAMRASNVLPSHIITISSKVFKHLNIPCYYCVRITVVEYGMLRCFNKFSARGESRT